MIREAEEFHQPTLGEATMNGWMDEWENLLILTVKRLEHRRNESHKLQASVSISFSLELAIPPLG